jgi:mitochondrial import inner membrane translocase subunit TIM50
MFRHFFTKSTQPFRLFSTQKVPSSSVRAASSLPMYLFFGGITLTGGLIAEDYLRTPNGLLSQLFNDKEGLIFNLYTKTIGSYIDDILLPSSDDLLPEWPTAPCYASLGIPPGTPAPPLLVLDLEKTLIASEHDPRFGWRHVKRPGVEKFIEQLSNYYEIVIFCENDIGMMEHVLMAIDKDGRTHKLGPSAGEQRNGQILKRLDCLNRDIRRIILIDDSPISAQKFLGNTILIEPFDDVRAKGDTVLLDLIPVLQAFVHHDGIKDFRHCLNDLGTNKANEIIEEYQMRVTKAKLIEENKRNRGLGKFLRQSLGEQSSNLSPTTSASSSSSSSSPSLMDLVGTSESEIEKESLQLKKLKEKVEKPTVVKRKGTLFEWLENSEKEKAEAAMKRREEMEAMYREKMMEKMKGGGGQAGGNDN